MTTQEARALYTAVWEVLEYLGNEINTEEISDPELHLVPDLSVPFVPAFCLPGGE